MGYNRSHRNASERFNESLNKRGKAASEAKKKKEDEELGPKLNPWVVGVLLFVVFGSALFQVLRNATAGPIL